MSIDVATGWTLERLLIELADATNNATYSTTTGAAIAPTDANLLDQFTRAINRGYRRFLRSDPHWTFLQQEVQIQLSADGTGGTNIDREPGLYLLPSYCVGAPKGDWTFADQSTDQACIIHRDATSVRRLRDANPNSVGVPMYAADYAVEPQGGQEQGPARRGLMLYPDPDSDLIIRGVFRVLSHDLVNLTDRHIAGAEHDLAILEQAKNEMALLEDKNAPLVRDELERSMALDKAGRVRTRGTFINTFRRKDVEHLPAKKTYLIDGQPIP